MNTILMMASGEKHATFEHVFGMLFENITSSKPLVAILIVTFTLSLVSAAIKYIGGIIKFHHQYKMDWRRDARDCERLELDRMRYGQTERQITAQEKRVESAKDSHMLNVYKTFSGKEDTSSDEDEALFQMRRHLLGLSADEADKPEKPSLKSEEDFKKDLIDHSKNED